MAGRLGGEHVVGVLKVVPGLDSARARKFVREFVEKVVLKFLQDKALDPTNLNNPISGRNLEKRFAKYLGNMTRESFNKLFELANVWK